MEDKKSLDAIEKVKERREKIEGLKEMLSDLRKKVDELEEELKIQEKIVGVKTKEDSANKELPSPQALRILRALKSSAFRERHASHAEVRPMPGQNAY